MMRRIGFLLLLLLMRLCAAKSGTCTTEQKCRNKAGVCQPKGHKCAGPIREGPKYCKDWETCGCCAPCSKGIKPPCKDLKGTCINHDDFCNGTAIMNKAFCKQEKLCKCCFPACDCDPVTCTYHNQDGRCSRHRLPDTKNVGPQKCKNGCECYIPDIPVNNEITPIQSTYPSCPTCPTCPTWPAILTPKIPTATCEPCATQETPTEGTIVSSILKWHFVGEDYFVRFNEMMTWHEAEDFCRKFGLELYQPRDISAVAHYLADNFPGEENSRRHHVGGRENGTHYLWLSGEVVSKDEPWWHENAINAVGYNGCLSIFTSWKNSNLINANRILHANYWSCQWIDDLNHPLCGNARSFSLEWHSVGSDRFVKYNRRMNWKDSRSMCKIHGLDLYIPKDPISVTQYLWDNLRGAVTSYYWLGAHGNGTAVVWLTGEVIDENSTLWWYGPKPATSNSYCLMFLGYVKGGTKVMSTFRCSLIKSFPLCG